MDAVLNPKPSCFFNFEFKQKKTDRERKGKQIKRNSQHLWKKGPKQRHKERERSREERERKNKKEGNKEARQTRAVIRVNEKREGGRQRQRSIKI